MVDIKKAIEEAKRIDKEYNYFNVISEDLALKQRGKKGKLAGQPISVKDCICVKNVESRAGSAILNGYKPLFNASVVEKIIKEGGVIIGKTSQDEFGFGSFNVNVGNGFKVPKNPFDKTRVTGGSSGGACGIVQKSEFQSMAVAESTGGSIAAPASFCGVYGLCPTYGRVSRYGVMDYGSSLDKIGPVGKSIDDLKMLFDVISGYDDKDSTSLDVPVTEDRKEAGRMKVAIVKESFGEGVDEPVKDIVEEKISGLESSGIKVEKISLQLSFKYGVPAYYILAMSEASTNLALYCGMRYGQHEKLEGNFNDYFSSVRSKYFNTESKRRILLGTFARMSGFRDAYYIKAAMVRTKIIQEYKLMFRKYDAIITPTMPVLPLKFNELENLTPVQNYMMDILTAGPNLAGLPHLNVPVGFVDKLPVGMLLTADHLQESKLMTLGSV